MWHSKSITQKELNLKEVKPKPKPEAKPILRSLRDGLENLKKTASRERSQTRQPSTGGGFLEKITKLTSSSKSRNPAKKSASFTFAVRPEVAMSSGEKYASLETDVTSPGSSRAMKQQVQRSVSAGVLESRESSRNSVELQPNYARVRDSLVLPSTPRDLTKAKAEDIYAEICENAAAERGPNVSANHVVAKVKIVVRNNSNTFPDTNERNGHNNYVNLIHTSQQIDSIINTDVDVVYNTVFWNFLIPSRPQRPTDQLEVEFWKGLKFLAGKF